MQVPDFSRSFLTFRIDLHKQTAITVSHKPPFSLNNARIQLESRCLIHDRQTDMRTEYVLGASCKTERVGVERDIWIEPNADFCPIFSQDEFLTLKSWDKNAKGVLLYPPSLGLQPERQLGKVAEAFDRVAINVRLVEGELLKSVDEIVQATLADQLLVGRIEFSARDRYAVTIEFPIKTMNANEREQIYQTDTGAILFPDFSIEFTNVMETFHLAYVAYNGPDWAEFILQTPTPLGEGISVNHYSKIVRLTTQNAILRIAN
ncbi:hypothetical protein BH10CHL1_BH10CHL1_11650 [soil metagenome]